ncbi:hypothetical protein R3P38DRAFT_1259219 [Favolaschia claudopus]|uniref:F-box domain-containing protein n=1 Tax=Favolaschia claudopus TaxID=2862362 RepID=A0AAW0B2H9_9AGAR
MAAQAADIAGIIEEHNASLKLVEAKLAEHHCKLYKIRAEMRSLTFKQSALIAVQRHLDREIRRCRGIVSPVRRLPREIIAEIFLHLAPALTTGHLFRATSWRNESRVPRVAIPWQLGRVCREWRTVAVSLHSLWNVCDFPSPPVTSSPEFGWSWMHDSEKVPTAEQTARIGRSLASVEARLCRSGPSPISAQVVYQDTAHTLPLVDTLCRHSHQLKGLLLVDLPQKLIDLLSNSIAQNSQLRSLGLASTSTSRERSYSFGYPSSLTNLHLSSLELSAAACSCIPWTQLTKYCEIKCSWRYADRWSSYTKLRNVVDLCVSFAEYCHKPQQPVLLPALRHARFTYFGAGSILQHFDTPILESLSYEHPKNADFELALPRRLPRLRSLRVRAENCPRFTCNLRHTMMMAPNLSEFFVAAQLPRAFDFVAALDSEERAEDGGSPPMQTQSPSPLALNLEVLRLQIDTDGPYCA